MFCPSLCWNHCFARRASEGFTITKDLLEASPAICNSKKFVFKSLTYNVMSYILYCSIILYIMNSYDRETTSTSFMIETHFYHYFISSLIRIYYKSFKSFFFTYNKYIVSWIHEYSVLEVFAGVANEKRNIG